MTRIMESIRRRTIFVVIASVFGSLLIVGTFAYHFLEDWSWVESFYFTVCTLTTIGYGDFSPTSDASRLFTAVFALVGVGVAFGSFGALGALYLRRGERMLMRLSGSNKGPQETK